MQYVNLGRSGLKVSRLCLGMMTYGSSQWREWILNEEQSRSFIQKAVESGINFFDTSNVYSMGISEEITGRALRDFARREEVVIATKVFFPYNEKPNQGGLSRLHILRAVEDSMRRLGTDYIDLYQVHRYDPETPVDETLEALHDLVKSGKVRYIGASSMYAWQFAQALYRADLHSWTRFISMQNHYNLVYREDEREMIPLCRSEGIGILPWSPLARGFLAGNRSRKEWGETTRAKTDDLGQKMYFQDEDFQIVERVGEVARQRGVTPAQIALAWVMHKPGVTAPILGASKPHHLEEALAALEIGLSPEEMRALEEKYQPHPVLGHT